MELGILTLLPIATLFAVMNLTKRVITSFLCATTVAAILLGKANFIGKWLFLIQDSAATPFFGWLCILLGMFGILITFLEKSGWVTQFAIWLSKYASSRRKALFITFILGILIFIDDYLNNIAVTTAMKRICDSYKVPRTYLAYIIGFTAAPVCILIPVSTWGAFYQGLFGEAELLVNGSAFSAYLQTIPLMFYAWITLVLIILGIIGIFPKLGITRKHERLAAETGVVLPAECALNDTEMTAPDLKAALEETAGTGKKASPIPFLLPMVILVVASILAGKDVLYGCVVTNLFVAIVFIVTKKYTLKEVMGFTFDGVFSMSTMYITVVMANTLTRSNIHLGMPDYVESVIKPVLDGQYLPALIMCIMGVYCYFCSGVWDVGMVWTPIIVPLAIGLGVSPFLAMGALICCTVIGSTLFVAVDAILVLSPQINIKPYYIMLAGLPYGIVAWALATVGYLIAGIAM